MRSVYPSDALKLLRTFRENSMQEGHERIHEGTAHLLRAFLAAMDQIPYHLVTWSSEQYCLYLQQRELLRGKLEQFHSRFPEKVTIFGDVLQVLDDLLSTLSDHAVPDTVHSLEFLDADQDFQVALRSDLASIESTLRIGEWKLATVVAGSIIESLLLWALSRVDRTKLQEAIVLATTLESGRELSREQREASDVLFLDHRPKPDLNDWDFRQYLVVAHRAGIVSYETAVAANLARNHRNLIHAGREKRLNQKCDKGTAFTSTGAAEKIISAVAQWSCGTVCVEASTR